MKHPFARRLLSCLLLLLIISTGRAEASLDEQVAEVFRKNKTTGGALLVAKDGQLVYEYYYGYANKRAGEPVTEETYFRSASVSKLVTAIHVMQLVEQGRLELDTSIGDYLGYEVKNLYYPQIPITLRHLMTHTSSLCSNGGYSSIRRPLQQILDASLNRRGNWYRVKPGSKYQYSNFGAGLMGSLIEAATGKNLNDSITDDLFRPLGMDAAFHPALVVQPEKITVQYSGSGTVNKSRERSLSEAWDAAVNPEMHFRITHGKLWIRPRDLLRLGIMMCQGGTLEETSVLKESTVQEMMADQKGHGYVTVSSPYGLCVNRVDSLLPHRLVYGHQGLSEGILCNLYWEPESRLVFCLMTNGCLTNMNNRIGVLSRQAFQLVWETFAEE